jgi:hypothetical protein
MRRILILLTILPLLVGCSAEPGDEGGPCYEDGTCMWEGLVCGSDGRCHPCGGPDKPCCQSDACWDCCVCGSDGSCEFCGDPEEPCCVGDMCHDCCSCGSDSLCHICGSSGQPCCEGQVCDDLSLCGSDGVCHACGGDGQPCCEGNTCSLEPASCGSDGLCHACGYTGLPCCEGNACIEGYVCGMDQMCQSCGRFELPCCEGNACDEWSICGFDALCHSCGLYDQPCCEGNTCQGDLECGSDGNCHTCGYYSPCQGNRCNEGYYFDDVDEKCYPYGYLGRRCAEGNVCNGWFECLEGVCVNPFKVDNSRSTSICEEAEPGNQESNRDWCYWYAAYLKNDTSICENIWWSQMKDKCVEGENPANYYVLPF